MSPNTYVLGVHEDHHVVILHQLIHDDLPPNRPATPGLRRYVKCRELPRVKNGLGMAIVKKIMDLHNGEIEIDSLPVSPGSTSRLMSSN